MILQHRPPRRRLRSDGRDRLIQHHVTRRVIQHRIKRIRRFWGGIFRVGVIHIKTRTISGHHIRHAKRIRIDRRNRVVSTQVKAPGIL